MLWLRSRIQMVEVTRALGVALALLVVAILLLDPGTRCGSVATAEILISRSIGSGAARICRSARSLLRVAMRRNF